MNHGDSGFQSSQKMICDTKRADSIVKMTSPTEFHEFSEQVLMLYGDRYPQFKMWRNWIGRLAKCPNEDAVDAVFGVGKDEANNMARDLWTLVTMKAQGTTRSAVTHAMNEDSSTLTRLSRFWFNLLRDSRGRVVDRQVALTTTVHCPTRLQSWAAVADGFRTWEIASAELESLSGIQLSGALRAQALLALVPEDLRNLALTQEGLEHRYEDLRDYMLNQAGRHDTSRTQQPDGMDLGRVDVDQAGAEQTQEDGQETLLDQHRRTQARQRKGWWKGIRTEKNGMPSMWQPRTLADSVPTSSGLSRAGGADGHHECIRIRKASHARPTEQSAVLHLSGIRTSGGRVCQQRPTADERSICSRRRPYRLEWPTRRA